MSSGKALSIEKRTLQSTIAGFLSFGLSTVQSILLVPILLRYWGEEKYALWIALWAFVMLMRMLDGGFLGLIGNKFAMALHKNEDEAAEVLGSAVRISFILSIIEIVVFILLWSTRMVESISGVPDKPQSLLYPAMFIALLPWALGGSILSVVLRAIPAVGLYSKMVYISMLSKLVEIAVLVVAGFARFDLFYVCASISLLTLVYGYILNRYLTKIIPQFYPWWRKGKWKKGIQYFKESLGLTLNSFLEQYTNNGIILLLSKTVGLVMLPVFTTIRTLTNTATQVTSIILDPLYPDIIRFHVHEEDHKITQLFLVNWLIMSVMINLPFATSLLFIEPLYNAWTVHKLTFDPNLFYLLVLTVSVSTFGRPMTNLIRSLNLLRQLNIISIVRFAVTFGFALPFIKTYGLWVLGASILISEIICSIILPIVFTQKYIPSLTRSDLIWAILPTGLLVLLFLSKSGGAHLYILILIFFILQFTVSYFQWTRLSYAAQIRIKALINL